MNNTEAEDALKWAKAYGLRIAAWEAALNWQHHYELAKTGLGPVEMRKDWASASLSLANQLRDMAETVYPSRK